jgi:hypothetical protein
MLDPLDLIGAVVGLAAVAVNIVALASTLPLSLIQRLALAGVLGGWAGLASGLAGAGALAFAPGQPVPLIGVLFATPPLVAGVLFLTRPGVRDALLSIPVPLLIGLNSLRAFAVLFLMLAAVGRLSGPFPYSAGWGDIITAAMAAPLALAASAHGWERYRFRIAAWNLFGALDLVAAITLGVTTSNGSPFQLLHSGVGAQAMQHLPFSLVPTVLVPFYLVTHGLVAAQLVQRPRLAAAT